MWMDRLRRPCGKCLKQLGAVLRGWRGVGRLDMSKKKGGRVEAHLIPLTDCSLLQCIFCFIYFRRLPLLSLPLSFCCAKPIRRSLISRLSDIRWGHSPTPLMSFHDISVPHSLQTLYHTRKSLILLTFAYTFSESFRNPPSGTYTISSR